MKILVINPVGHSTWNENDRNLYKRFLSPNTVVEVISLPRGPRTVESQESYEEASHLVVEIGTKLVNTYDGIIVNCFLDPGVDELRLKTGNLVIGAGEASLTLARLYGRPIYIVTVGAEKHALNLIWNRVKSLGFENVVADVIGVPLGVEDIDKDKEKTLNMLLEATKPIASKERWITFVLGCTGFGGYAEKIQSLSLIDAPVIDPVKASAIAIESLIKLARQVNMQHQLL
ncbi:MAG: aspartate/glutamate racemase family protein [Ignisphaera sp.]